MPVPKKPLTPEQKQRRAKRFLTFAIFAILLLVCGWLYYLYSRKANEVTLPTPVINNSSTGLFPEKAPEKKAEATKEGNLSITPTEVDMGTNTIDADQFTGSFSVRAEDAKAVVHDVRLPFAGDQGITLDAGACLNVTLNAGESCPVSITFAPHRPGNVRLQVTVSATLTRTDGSTKPISSTVSLIGVAVRPVQVAAAPAPVQVATKQADTADNGPSAEALEYIRRRQRPGNLAMQFDGSAYSFLTDRDPKQDDWHSIGYGTNLSTMPVDQSRVVTMDKPIPAVMKTPIDTRNPSRAIATVERDIYGGDGRLVVIERGSTLIGTAAAIGSTSEEKIGINWERLVRPDGSAWSFAATSGDAMGRSGAIGYIDQRWFERFGVSLLASAAVSGIDIAIGATQKTSTAASGITTQTQSPEYIASQQFSSNFQALFAQFAKEQLQVPPIRTMPVGSRITVYPTTDLWLRPIVPTDDMRAAYALNAQKSAAYREAMQKAYAAQQSVRQAEVRGGTGAGGMIPAAVALGTNGRPSYMTGSDPNGPAAAGTLPTTAQTPLVPTGGPDLAYDSDTSAGSGHAAFATEKNASQQYSAANPQPLGAQVPANNATTPGGFGSGTYAAGGFGNGAYGTPSGLVGGAGTYSSSGYGNNVILQGSAR